ncbi:MAG: zinc dependent phospholipase C family protein [Saprospiraceae bacterium]|nr:zinc dependent phospholipase C family protein [Saprospiraceae bacterium]
MSLATWSVVLALQCFGHPVPVDMSWGFYSHRLINRMAVFTLPSDLIAVYKQNIDYISDHAVDPDKRRYATRHEAVRHYIDIDHWGTYPFDNVPRRWGDALLWQMEILGIVRGAPQDTQVIMDFRNNVALPDDPLRQKLLDAILPIYYDDEWVLTCDSILNLQACQDYEKVIAREHFTEYGILPYHLLHMQERLTRAFAQQDLAAVLRISADFGHYLADAHVPLHTTENYNGQLTGQLGIHAFWETRIPELFAEDEFDFMVGRAEYIADPATYYWGMVLKSHQLAGEVLEVERQLRQAYRSDAQFCFEERLEVTNRTQCAAYARAYHEAMNGMVEERMRSAILAIGSAWYTAWVDAGQPSFEGVRNVLSPQDQATLDDLERQFRLGTIHGRAHRN